MGSSTTVDWEALRIQATEMAQRAYAPYSGVHVGSAGVCENGDIVTGCNVENASYGLTQCAECSLVAALVANGGGKLVAVCTVAGDGAVLAPCGRCRQVLYEFGGGDLEIETPDGPVALSNLLPWAFGPEDVATRTGNASDS